MTSKAAKKCLGNIPGPGDRTPSPYGLKIIEDCLNCTMRAEGFFCDLSPEVLQAFEAIKYTSVYPKEAVLFVEGQSPRGIFVVCEGRVKQSTSSSEGKTVITGIAAPGDVLGLSATVSGQPYEVTAQTLEPCQVNFAKREDFLRFLEEHGQACLRVAQHLSHYYQTAYKQIRSFGLSQSAMEKLAKLLLQWGAENGKETERGFCLKLGLTQEEIAEMIGTSRETVTRLFGELKRKQIIQLKGSTLVIRNMTGLQDMVSS